MIQPPGHHLAQLNWGRLRYGWDDPRSAGFVDGIARVNGVAERSRGFVWRLSDEDMEAQQTGAHGAFGGDPMVASTLSVWEDVDSFVAFVFRTIHSRFMDQAEDWFRDGESGRVFWWVPEGTRPTVHEGLMRHRRMLERGEDAQGFTWEALGLATGNFPRQPSA